MANPECRFLTPAQFEEFCRLQRLDPAAVEPRSNGAHRDVLMAPGQVYFFPRKPQYAASMRHELAFLREIGTGGLPGVPMPRFLDLLEYPSVFAGPIGVVSRLEGGNWEDIQEQFSGEFIAAALEELVDLFLLWHGTPAAAVPSVSAAGERLPFSEIPPMQAWLADSLHPATAEAAAAGLHARIVAVARELGVSPAAVESDATAARWAAALARLAALPPALLHGDMHEGQILIQPNGSRNISGLLDWEAVQFGNPVMDFSFHKWGWGRVWVFHDQFPALRRRLWGRYLDGRGVTGLSPDSLHLYCALTEMLRTILEREGGRRPSACVTRKPFPESMAEQLETLRAATECV